MYCPGPGVTYCTQVHAMSYSFITISSVSDPDWIRIRSGQWISCKFFQFLVIKALDPDRHSAQNAGSGSNEYGSQTLIISSSDPDRHKNDANPQH